MNAMKKARVIAFYLPQFHPIPENDEVWGKGFTEWTNLAKAKPLFRGHVQPHIPADLGFYDLRMPEVREKQVALAKEAGVEGFCYWHYWFGNGKTLMQEIFDDVVKSGKPDFPFCVGWANHSWSTKTWTEGRTFQKDKMIVEQTYPGKEDHIAHFYSLLDAFKDRRYITVDGKLLFLIYDPVGFPETQIFFDLWNKLAQKEGLKGFHFVGVSENVSLSMRNMNKDAININSTTKEIFESVFSKGFDAVNSRGYQLAQIRATSKILTYIKQCLTKFLKLQFVKKYDYKIVSKLLFTEEDKFENVYPTIIPNWDRSPRSGKNAYIWYNYDPKYFQQQVELALELIKSKSEEHKILFLMSWNEWGEGNYMEPDLEYGHGYIQALKNAII